MSKKDLILNKADEINANISDLPVVRGLINGGLSMIPFWGPAISSALNTRVWQLFERNSRTFAEELHRVVSRIDEEKIDKDFLESNEFTSLLLTVLMKNAKTHQQEKVRLFVRAFISACLKKESEMTYKEDFFDMIDTLSVEHVAILGYVYARIFKLLPPEFSPQYNKDTNSPTAEQIGRRFGMDREEAVVMCEQLMKHNLIIDPRVGTYGGGGKDYGLSHYGIRFCEFLRVVPDPEADAG